MEYKLKVIVADDHYIFRHGFIELLKTIREVEVIAEAENGEELVEACGRLEPDAVFCDIMMPKLDGIRATKMIMNMHPDTMIFAMSMVEDMDKMDEMLNAGAKGYLLKDATGAEIIELVSAAKRRAPYFSESAKSIFIDLKTGVRPKSDVIPFNEKELAVIRGICETKTTDRIARDIHLSPKTVSEYRTRIMMKIGCKNVHGIINYAHKYNLLKE